MNPNPAPTRAERLASLARLDVSRRAVPHVPDIRLASLSARLGRPVRIAVVRLDGIGDWVLTLPILTALAGSADVASVSVVAPAGLRGLFAKAPIEHFVASSVPTIIAPPWPGGLLGRARAAAFPTGLVAMREGALLAGRFDLVVLARWDADLGFNMRAWAVGAKAPIAGYAPRTVPSATGRERREGRLLSCPIETAVPASHEIEHLRSLMRALDLPDEVGDGFGARFFGVDPGAARSSAAHPFVVMHTTSNEPKRQWSAVSWRALIERVLRTSTFDVVLAGSRSDADRIAALSEGLGDRVRAAVGAPLSDLPGLLAAATAFVGNDSGPAHIAASIGVPTVVISPHPADGDPAHRNSPVRYAPWGSAVRVLQPATGIGGCKLSCTATVAHCIDTTRPEHVLGALGDLLGPVFSEAGRSTDTARGV